MESGSAWRLEWRALASRCPASWQSSRSAETPRRFSAGDLGEGIGEYGGSGRIEGLGSGESDRSLGVCPPVFWASDISQKETAVMKGLSLGGPFCVTVSILLGVLSRMKRGYDSAPGGTKHKSTRGSEAVFFKGRACLSLGLGWCDFR